jgi:uncharacterized caspase-like protein
MRSLGILALGVALIFSCGARPADAAAEKRIALVIGNGAYVNAPRLSNPSHDAEDVAAALKRSDFEVILGTDLSQAGMGDVAIRFARASRAADVAVFYYSGHAMQFNGVNYLMPVDARLEDEADLKRMTRVDDILDDLQRAKNLRILVLDSCRDNPLADTLKRSIGLTRGASMQRGLTKIEAPLGTIVSFSTQAGRTADDGDGRNSPYTTAFLKHIEEPNEIGDVFREISGDVYQASNKTQLPELSLSIVGKFYLNGPVSVTVNPPAQAAPVDPCSAAEAHWKAADSIGTIAAFEDHVARFPRCAFADLAKARIDQLKQKTVLAPPAAAQGGSAGRAKGLDGNWSVTIVCENDHGAKGYILNFLAAVKDGVLHGERLTSGTPGWVAIDGPIGSDGSAMLSARGLTDVPAYTINQVKSGTPYAYTVDAHFDGSRGTGKRIEVRACALTFAKR